MNEQNPGAVAFYFGKGFMQVDRSEVDDDGKPYPILRLKLACKASTRVSADHASTGSSAATAQC